MSIDSATVLRLCAHSSFLLFVLDYTLPSFTILLRLLACADSLLSVSNLTTPGSTFSPRSFPCLECSLFVSSVSQSEVPPIVLDVARFKVTMPIKSFV